MNFKKSLCTVLSAAVIMTSACAVPASAEWVKTDQGKKYTDEDGSYVKGWQTIGGKKYYFKSNGVMHTGWLKTSSGKKYYFGSNGVMRTGWMKTKSGKRYYFRSNGVMAAGIKLKISGKVYTFGDDGVLIENKSTPSTSDTSVSSADYETLRLKRDEAERMMNEYTNKYNEEKAKKQEVIDRQDKFKDYASILSGYMDASGRAFVLYAKLSLANSKVIDKIVRDIAEETGKDETEYWVHAADVDFFDLLYKECYFIVADLRDEADSYNAAIKKALDKKNEYTKLYKEYNDKIKELKNK